MLITHAELNARGTNNGLATPTAEKRYYTEDIMALKGEGANMLICLDTDYPKLGVGPSVPGKAAAGAIVNSDGINYSGRMALPCPPHCDKEQGLTADLTFAEAENLL